MAFLSPLHWPSLLFVCLFICIESMHQMKNNVKSNEYYSFFTCHVLQALLLVVWNALFYNTCLDILLPEDAVLKKEREVKTGLIHSILIC